MSMSFMPGNPGCLPNSAPCSKPPLGPATPQSCDYSFKRLVPFLESPTVGTGILALTFFFFIAFLSDPVIGNVTSMTLGIAVTVSTFVILTLILFILFLL